MNNKHVFWQALLVTILIFAIGIIIGVIIENWRTNRISSLSDRAGVDLLDVNLQSSIYSLEDFNCNSAVKENINFADRIYEEAKLLSRYESASRLTDSLILQRKKYDILRAIVLVNSIRIKEKCNSTYYDVVYFYQYNNPSISTRAEQNVFSKILEELKNKHGDKILLLPISGDNDISSINLLMKKYNLSKENLPVIVINGKVKLNQLETVKDLDKYFE